MTTDTPQPRPDPAGGDSVTRDTPRQTGMGRIVSGVLGSMPTLLVLAALGGIAWWGHHTGWKAPRLSRTTEAATAAREEDWCGEHNVPESRCIKCHPELVGASAKDWCPEHGVPESKCTICHPEILKTGVAGDWCPEHGVPESSCTLCHPEIAVKGTAPPSATGASVSLDTTAALTTPIAPAGAASDGHGGHAHVEKSQSAPSSGEAGHGAHAQAEGAQSSAKDPKTCQTHAMRVQFASGEAVRKAGVQLGQVVERPMSATLSANAEVDYNRNRLAQISSPVPGKVWRVETQVGQSVKQGEVVALVDAAEVGNLKAELLQAIADLELKSKTVKRMRTSAESGFRTGAELEEAEAAVQAADIRLFNAQQALTNLGLTHRVGDPHRAGDLARLLDRKDVQFMGLPKSVADRLDPKTTTASLLPLTAPFDGVVIEQHVVAGEVIEPSRPLLVIADTSQMWVTADLPLADARRIALGQGVTFRQDDAPDHSATGQVSWISTAVDDQTRTVKVRAKVANPDGRLLAHTFGKAAITIRQKPSVVAIPSEAIQWEGCCHIAFVRLTDDIFQTRKLKLGTKANGFTEVTVGVLPGEVVATGGSHVLKSELLKSALGAGCADGH